MSLEQARQFADQAAQSLAGGQTGLALELADQALSLAPDLADAHNLRGVALSNIGRPKEAEDAFRRAAAYSKEAKPIYNMAVHAYRRGDRGLALDLASAALDREPAHAQAFALHELLTGKSGGSYVLRPPQPHLDWSKLPNEEAKKSDWPGSARIGWYVAGYLIAILSAVLLAVAIPQTQGENQLSIPIATSYLLVYLVGLAFLLVHAMNRGRSLAWGVVYAFGGCVLGSLILVAYLLSDLRLSDRPKSGTSTV